MWPPIENFELPRILIMDKKELFSELNTLGINDYTMFPDLEHYAKYLKNGVSKG